MSLKCTSNDKNEKLFITSFVEGVWQKLYLPQEHTNVINYHHWLHLAGSSLRDMSIKWHLEPSGGKTKEGCFYEIITPTTKIRKIVVMEKEFMYFIAEEIFHGTTYYKITQIKKEQLEGRVLNQEQLLKVIFSKPDHVVDGQHKRLSSLVHRGVILPPSYMSHGIKLLYKGKEVELTSEQEEAATMFAIMKETDYYDQPQFKENFWNDWQALLGEKYVVQNLEDCDFNPIFE